MPNFVQRIKRPLRIFVFVVILSVVIIYAIACVGGYDALTMPPPRLPIATPEGAYETVTFPARGQTYTVYGDFLPGLPDRPALITAHGFKGSRFAQGEMDRARDLRQLGYNILTIDLSDNAGQTVGNGHISMGFGERWDVLGAYDYLLSKGFKPNRIGLVAESMGATTSLLAAALEPRIKAVWADSGYSRTDTILDEQAAHMGIPPIIVMGGMVAGWLISRDRLWEAAAIDAASILAEHKQAVYLIHDEQDQTVPFHHGVDLFNAYKAAGGDVTFLRVFNADHNEALPFHQGE